MRRTCFLDRARIGIDGQHRSSGARVPERQSPVPASQLEHTSMTQVDECVERADFGALWIDEPGDAYIIPPKAGLDAADDDLALPSSSVTNASEGVLLCATRREGGLNAT